MKKITEQAIIFATWIRAASLIPMMRTASSNEHQPYGNEETSPFSVKHRSPPQDNRTGFHLKSAATSRSIESSVQ
jgi:hypothetical protein